MIRQAGLRGHLVLATLALVAMASAAMAAPKFPPLTGRVVDNAGLLSPQAEQRLSGQLSELEAKTGRQMVVATLPDLQGYEIEDFGYQLGRAWGIGDRTRNDGVLLLVAPKERKVRVDVGYGLEGVLTDALSSLIIQNKILPAFRAGKMEEGVMAGAEALIGQLSLPDDQAKAIAAAPPQDQSISAQDGVQIFLIILVILWVFFGVLRGGRRGRGAGALWLLSAILSSGGSSRGGGGGGFSGGGGSFGGGGSSGGW